jgi:predicted PurR-regulated permease PerM
MNQQQKIAQLKNDRAEAQVALTQPDPPESTEANWRVLSRFSVVGTFFILLVAALFFSRSILMPVLAAMIIGVTLSPVQKWAAEYKIPPVLTAAFLMMAFFGLLYLAALLVIGPLTADTANAPDFGKLIKEKLRWLEGPLGSLRDLSKSMGGGEASNLTVAVETSVPSLVQQAARILTPAVTEFLVFFGTLLFFLVGIERLRRQLIVTFGSRDARLRVVRIWKDVEQNLVTYVATVTVINLGLGVVTTLMLFLLGFPNPVAFGVLAFVLNYIPYIGPALLVFTLFVVGLIATPTLGSAALPPVLFVVIATIEGHFITPGIVGRRLTLSPFLVFLALAFWTWLWGPLGAFMATPLLIVGLVVLSHLFPREENVNLPG